MFFKIIRFLFIFFIFLQPVEACKLWAVLAKSNFHFNTLSDLSKNEFRNQLLSFYYQSASMPDGWALLRYDNDIQGIVSPLYRSLYSAIEDSTIYWESVDMLLQENQSIIGIGHLRAATSGSVTIPNPHPWIFDYFNQSYSLIHNGTISKELLYNLITDYNTDISWLDSHPPQTFGGGSWRDYGWANVVDSELLLLFIMKKIDNNQNIFDGYVMAINELLNAGVNANQLNMILSDGSTLIIFGGKNRLYINDSDEYFSAMTQPPVNENSNWDGISNQELIVVNKDSLIRYTDLIPYQLNNSVLIPSFFDMTSAYPNPFNGSVYFSLDGPFSDDVNIKIYSLIGERVDQFIVSGLNFGKIHTKWTPSNNVSSGTYFIEASIKGSKQNQKILFIK